jgi:aerobic-type carbon monoxide dehydrogenase small subunit (CoxS/CutS family)
MAETIRLNVNGNAHEVTTDKDRSLLQVLREDLDLTGTKYGCGEASCGACTVLLGGQPTRSCVTPVGAVGSQPVVTIEGLAKGDKLHPVQEAFLEADALQCGYCTSGMILSAVALLRKNPHPDEAGITSGLQGNVCRCGTYRRIVRAVQIAARPDRKEAQR